MAEEKRAVKTPHNLIMEERSKLTITAVNDVTLFEETNIILVTEMGELAIKGDSLRISKLSVDTGEINIEGNIDYLVYTDEPAAKGGFFSRLFR